MKNSIIWVLAVLLLVLTGFITQSSAGVDLRIGVGVGVPVPPPPPPYAFSAPPDVVVIPGSYVYMVPGIEADILFYGGFWWHPFEGHWYRGRGYNGPWAYVGPGRLPRALVELPPRYREMLPGMRPIPFGQLQKNWRGWEKSKYWERDEKWRGGRAEHPGREQRELKGQRGERGEREQREQREDRERH